jgi:hypothetical protein
MKIHTIFNIYIFYSLSKYGFAMSLLWRHLTHIWCSEAKHLAFFFASVPTTETKIPTQNNFKKWEYFRENLLYKFTQEQEFGTRHQAARVFWIFQSSFLSYFSITSISFGSINSKKPSPACWSDGPSTTQWIYRIVWNADNHPLVHYPELPVTIMMSPCNSHSRNSSSYNSQTKVTWIAIGLLLICLQFKQILLWYRVN